MNRIEEAINKHKEIEKLYRLAKILAQSVGSIYRHSCEDYDKMAREDINDATTKIMHDTARPFAEAMARELKIHDCDGTDCCKSTTASIAWPDPTPELLEDPRFEAVWQCIKTWDINVPEVYEGYSGATGNHVRAILDALATVAKPNPSEKSAELIEASHETITNLDLKCQFYREQLEDAEQSQVLAKKEATYLRDRADHFREMLELKGKQLVEANARVERLERLLGQKVAVLEGL